MTSKNDITGDKLISKIPTKEYQDNYDRIFRREQKRCSYCDTMNDVDDVVCKNCGEELK